MREKLEKVKKRIAEAAEGSGRDPGSVRLVAVSKTMPADVVRQAIEAGADILGENYVQEARDKIAELSDLPVAWHFIGGLQSNKAKYVVKLFDLIHSVDSAKLMKEIDKQAKKIDKVQDILIQVNIAGEEQKWGTSPEETLELLEMAARLDNVAIKGLMTMPPFFDDPERARPFFRRLKEMRDRLAEKIEGFSSEGNVRLDELSMGMTGDFEAAVEEGATLVRIGTAIFGHRR